MGGGDIGRARGEKISRNGLIAVSDRPSGQLLRLAWRLGGHTREPTRKERRALMRKVRALLAGKRSRGSCLPRNQPGNGDGSYDAMMRFLERWFEMQESIGRHPEALARWRGGESITNIKGIRPWKGKAGRQAAKESIAERTDGRTLKARELERHGVSRREIAKALGVHPRSVRRWLKEDTPKQQSAAPSLDLRSDKPRHPRMNRHA